MWDASKGFQMWISLETLRRRNYFSLNVFQFYSIWVFFFSLQRCENMSYFQCHSPVIEGVIKSSVYRRSLKHSSPSHDLWRPHKRPIYHTLRGSGGQGYTVCVRLYRPCMSITSGDRTHQLCLYVQRGAHRPTKSMDTPIVPQRGHSCLVSDGPFFTWWNYYWPSHLFYSCSLKRERCIKSV